jgi:S1-C subfamily serine protease
MDLAETAFRRMWALAEADGEVTKDERKLLEQYRRALGLTKEGHPASWNRRSKRIPTSDEAADILRMMARVAAADGHICEKEHVRLKDLADSLEIGQLEVADILVGAERAVQHRHHLRKRLIMVGGGFGIVAFALVTMQLVSTVWGKTSEDRITEIQTRLDSLSAGAATWEDMETLRRSVAEEIDDIVTDPNLTESERRRELDRVDSRIESTGDRHSAYRRTAELYGQSVLLIATDYLLTAPDGTIMNRRGWGTGFFVTPMGLIATNKHVVQPWETPSIGKMVQDGYKVGGVTRIAAWPAGSQVLNDQRKLVYEAAFTTKRKNLKAVAVHPDGKDLALLRATVSAPVISPRLSIDPDDTATTDPILVFGFRGGIEVIEGLTAELQFTTGIVSMAGQSIKIDASIMPGSSGGPVFDTSGRVVGIATSIWGDPTHGVCTRARDLLPMLPTAGELLDEAESVEARGEPEAARRLINLARKRGPDEADTGRIEEMSSRLKGSQN